MYLNNEGAQNLVSEIISHSNVMVGFAGLAHPNIDNSQLNHSGGISRRELLRAGGLGLCGAGLSPWSGTEQADASEPSTDYREGKAKRCILLYLMGAASQLAKMANTGLSEARSQPEVKQLGLGKLLNGITVTAQGRELTAKLRISSADLRQLIDTVTKLIGM